MKTEAQMFQEYNNNFSDTTMRLLLDGTDLLKEVEIFLKGYYYELYYDENAETTNKKKVIIGEAKVNDKGLQSIMFWLKTKITPLMSMGNISEDQYRDFLSRTRRNLASSLMIQRINYGLTLSNYLEVMDYIMDIFEGFYSSAINAGHRRSFTKNSSVETKEYVEKEKEKRFGVF